MRSIHRLLECLAEIDADYLRTFPETPALYRSGVRYAQEPPGIEDFCDIPTILQSFHQRNPGERVFVDCEDLAAWRAAELRLAGVRAVPTFNFSPMIGGGASFHVQTLRPDGVIEDPSVRLGMKG